MKNKNKSGQEIEEKKVSIIIPVYNREFSLAKTIDSILKQTYKNYELIIIDDGSSDNSFNIINNYTKVNKDILSFRQDNKGACSARNYGLRVSNGDYVLFLDSDDVIEKDHIEKYIKMINSCENCCVYGPWSLYSDSDGHLVHVKTIFQCKSNDMLEAWIEGWWVACCSILWPKNVIDILGGWNEELLADQDGDLVLRALANDFNFIYCNYAPPSKIITYMNQYSISKNITIDKLLSRVNVLKNIEKILSDKNKLSKKYRKSMCVRYYNYAQYYEDNYPEFACFCYKEYKRLGCLYRPSGSFLNYILIFLLGVNCRNFLAKKFKNIKKTIGLLLFAQMLI